MPCKGVITGASLTSCSGVYNSLIVPIGVEIVPQCHSSGPHKPLGGHWKSSCHKWKKSNTLLGRSLQTSTLRHLHPSGQMAGRLPKPLTPRPTGQISSPQNLSKSLSSWSPGSPPGSQNNLREWSLMDRVLKWKICNNWCLASDKSSMVCGDPDHFWDDSKRASSNILHFWVGD